MEYSNSLLCTMSVPKTEKPVEINGSMAQWIAQAAEAVMPNASQFSLNDMQRQMYKMQLSCKNFIYLR